MGKRNLIIDEISWFQSLRRSPDEQIVYCDCCEIPEGDSFHLLLPGALWMQTPQDEIINWIEKHYEHRKDQSEPRKTLVLKGIPERIRDCGFSVKTLTTPISLTEIMTGSGKYGDKLPDNLRENYLKSLELTPGLIIPNSVADQMLARMAEHFSENGLIVAREIDCDVSTPPTEEFAEWLRKVLIGSELEKDKEFISFMVGRFDESNIIYRIAVIPLQQCTFVAEETQQRCLNAAKFPSSNCRYHFADFENFHK